VHLLDIGDLHTERSHSTGPYTPFALYAAATCSERCQPGLNGRSSRIMLDELCELSRQFWGRHMWARGYFVASSGNVTDEVIKQ
jgi:hypothetical protein